MRPNPPAGAYLPAAPLSRVRRESLPELGRHVAEAARALSADPGWR